MAPQSGQNTGSQSQRPQETPAGTPGRGVESNIELIKPVTDLVVQRLREKGLIKTANEIASESLDANHPKIIKFILECEGLKHDILKEMEEDGATRQELQIARNYFRTYLETLRS
mgnify:FL=1|jgi:hypothetical protein